MYFTKRELWLLLKYVGGLKRYHNFLRWGDFTPDESLCKSYIRRWYDMSRVERHKVTVNHVPYPLRILLTTAFEDIPLEIHDCSKFSQAVYRWRLEIGR